MPTRKTLPKMLQFLRDNTAAPRAALTVKAEGDTAEIYLFDVIDPYWGISAEAFAKTLAGITAKTVNLHINSPGGDVFEARAMVAAIRNFPGKVVAKIDGLAASAASYVALAAAEVEMTQGAFMMIHNAWTIAFGNASELRTMADLLDKIDASIVHDYMQKTGKDEAAVKAWMTAETWFTADEAKAEGFVDRVTDGAAASNKWNLAAFDHTPQALIDKPSPPAPAEDLLRANAARRMRLLETEPA